MPSKHVLLFVELEERPKYRCRWANKRLYDCGKNSSLGIFYEKKLKEIGEGVSSEKQPRFSTSLSDWFYGLYFLDYFSNEHHVKCEKTASVVNHFNKFRYIYRDERWPTMSWDNFISEHFNLKITWIYLSIATWCSSRGWYIFSN